MSFSGGNFVYCGNDKCKGVPQKTKQKESSEEKNSYRSRNSGSGNNRGSFDKPIDEPKDSFSKTRKSANTREQNEESFETREKKKERLGCDPFSSRRYSR